MTLNVSAATLTYGERKTFLYQVVDRLLIQNFDNIYVYCNGISLVNLNEIKERYKKERVTILYSKNNLGSAGGYHELLNFVTLNSKSDHVLLLDDDNLVPKDCYDIIKGLDIKEDELYSFHRSDRIRAKLVKELKRPEDILGSSNSFLGRDIFSIFRTTTPIYQGDLAAAPYGGLLLSRKSLEVGALPKKELYLYADDYEYTHRLVTKFNFNIIFSEALSIKDLEKSFHLKKGNRLLSNRYSNASENQLYYSVRNNTWLGLNRCKSKTLYKLNLCFYSTLFILQCLITFKFKTIKTFVTAIKDGFFLYFSDKQE